MKNADQTQANAAPKRVYGRPFAKGNPGGGRKRVTDADRKLQAMTRAEVEAAFQRLLGPALKRLEELVAKGADGDSLKALALVLDRAVGPVPSASYIAAQLSNASGNPGGVGCIEFTEQDALVAMASYIQQHGQRDESGAVVIDMAKD